VFVEAAETGTQEVGQESKSGEERDQTPTIYLGEIVLNQDFSNQQVKEAIRAKFGGALPPSLPLSFRPLRAR
jgi:hypothetical protein